MSLGSLAGPLATGEAAATSDAELRISHGSSQTEGQQLGHWASPKALIASYSFSSESLHSRRGAGAGVGMMGSGGDKRRSHIRGFWKHLGDRPSALPRLHVHLSGGC